MSSTPSLGNVKNNAAVLSNAALLVSSIMLQVKSSSISATLNATPVTRDRIEQLAVARLAASIK